MSPQEFGVLRTIISSLMFHEYFTALDAPPERHHARALAWAVIREHTTAEVYLRLGGIVARLYLARVEAIERAAREVENDPALLEACERWKREAIEHQEREALERAHEVAAA